MYPDFRYLLHGLFGITPPEQFALLKTFGFMVALSFIGAAATLVSELKRKEKLGIFGYKIREEEVGLPATTGELLTSALIGLLLGYKIGGVISHFRIAAPDPLGYFFSLKGNIVAGIIGALLLAYLKYAEKKKRQLEQPKKVKVKLYPHQRLGEIIVIAAVGGLVGAKLFNAFETWDEFIKNPAESLLSSAGLTFYGGLIVAAVGLFIWCRRNGISFRHLCDAAAPGLILAYGIGRLGCQLSGDGDWGIVNSAYVTQADGTLKAATEADYQLAVQSNANYFLHEFGTADPGLVPHLHVPGAVLPRWFFAMNYPQNVNHAGIPLPGCTGDYCGVLPVAVFPTPIYEAITCILIFLLLWSIRRKIRRPLHLFGIYLILNGLERFFVEKIRVNSKYDWGFIHPTQAEIIATALVLAGIGILVFYKPKDLSPAVAPASEEPKA